MWPVFFLTMLVACGGRGDSPGPDTGVDSAGGDSGLPDSGPEALPVAAPQLPEWPCPEGWREVDAGDIAPGLSRCEPWPEDEAPCAMHEVRLPGDPGCRAIGPECPVDGWPADLPDVGVVYVRPGAAGPPDGSRAAPYPDAIAALAALPEGTTTLALSVGEYPGLIEIPASMTIRGACAEGTVLTNAFRPIFSDGLEHLILEDLTFSTGGAGRVVLGATHVQLRRVAFHNAVLMFDGAEHLAEDLVFRGDAGGLGTAITALGADRVKLSRVLIEDFPGGGITVLGPTGAHLLEDVYLRRISGGALNFASFVTLRRVVVDGAEDLGLVALGGGRLDDVVIRRITKTRGDSAGVVLGGDWTLEHLHVARSADVALTFGDGRIALRDAIIEGPTTADGARGRGVVLASGASLTAQRIVIAHTRELAVLADARSSAALSDVMILRVAESLDGGFGRCLHGQLGAQLALERAVLEDCTEAAVTVYGNAAVTLRDVRVSRVSPTGCSGAGGCVGNAGIGLLALPNGVLDAERFVVEGCALAGVIIVEDADTDLRDGTIRDNPIGANIQSPSYDLGRLMDRVIFIDNARNLDSTALPLPGDVAPTDG